MSVTINFGVGYYLFGHLYVYIVLNLEQKLNLCTML